MPGKARSDKACFWLGYRDRLNSERPWVESSLRGGSWVGLYFWLGYRDRLNSGQAHGSRS